MPRDYSQAGPAQYQRKMEYLRDETWIRAFLHRSLIGHVAHSRNGQPFITPTNFWFDEENHAIIFHSSITGRLRDNLEHEPRVCLETSEFGHFLPANTALEFSTQYRSVMVYGAVEIITDANLQRRALYGLLNKYFPHMTPGKEYRPITDQELAQTTVYALRIEAWSGKENWVEMADQLPDWPSLPDELVKS